MADPNNASRIIRWCLDRVEDVHGNYMTISYTLDQDFAYLSRIDYTGNSAQGLPPTHSVQFHLEGRTDAVGHEDAPPLYYTKYLTKIAKRLKTIEIRANGNLVRAYKLTYSTSTYTKRSLLTSVQQFGKDAIFAGSTVIGGTSLPPVTFTYQTGGNGTFTPQFTLPAANSSNCAYLGPGGIVVRGDWNGDGITDMLHLEPNDPDPTKSWVALANGDGTFEFDCTLPGSSLAQKSYLAPINTQPPLVGDWNGDGKDDLLHLEPSKTDPNYSWVAISNGNGTFNFENNLPWRSQITFEINLLPFERPAVGDWNGDGKDDLARFYSNGATLQDNPGTWVALSNGNGTFNFINPPPLTIGPAAEAGIYEYRTPPLVGDWNGDGNADLMYVQPYTYEQYHPLLGSYYVWMAESNGDGSFSINNYIDDLTPEGYQSKNLGDFQHVPQVSDINGDGLSDIMSEFPNRKYDWMTLSHGDGVFPYQIQDKGNAWWHGECALEQALCDTFNTQGDWNGDGRVDLLVYYFNFIDEFQVALSLGDGTFDTYDYTQNNYVSFPELSEIGRQPLLGDWNGDGKTDLLNFVSWPGYPTFVALADGKTPDLLASMSNGYGGVCTIEYVPSTKYANTQLHYPVQTVKTITTDDGNGNVATTTHEFSGGYHHIEEREFRGFNYAKVVGPVGPNGEQAIEETYFLQGNDIAVDVNALDFNDPSVADGYLKGAVYLKRVSDASGNLFTETQTVYTPDDDGLAPFYTPPAQVVTKVYNGDATFVQTRTDFFYDEYGNVIREEQHKEVGEPSDDITVARTFSPNTSAWILGLPTSEINYAGIGTGGTQVTRTDFYYDGTTSCDVASTLQTPTKGLLTRTVKWLSASTDPETRIAYDALGNPVCSKNANGNTTSMTYDSEGFFETTFTDSLGFVTTTQYYGVDGVAADNGIYGQVKKVTDPNGAELLTAYDALGRVTSVTQPDGFVTTTSYNNFGTLDTQNFLNSQHVRSDSSLNLSTFSYFDGLGRKIRAEGTGTDGRIIVSTTEYDVRGAVEQSSIPYFKVGGSPLYTTVKYDAVGRVLETTNPDETRTLTCYEDFVQVSINANDQRKRVVQDADGRAIAVQEYEGTFNNCDTSVGAPYATTSYEYDVLGNLLKVTDAQNNESTMQYDDLSRKVLMNDPDMGQWTYDYDTVGNLTLQTDAKGQQIHFRYDVLNRQVQKDFGTQKALGSGDVVYTFDGATSNGIGRLTNVVDSSGSSTFFYDIAGRGIKTDKVIGGVTYTTQSVYDGLGRITSLTYPDSSVVTHTYNGPQLESVQEGSTTYVSYAGFNALGQPATTTSGNGVVTTYTYDPQNFRLKTLKTVNGSTTLQDLGYNFDAGGNVLSITNPIHGNQTFVYDDLNRLISATGMTPQATTYTYDKLGNMLSNQPLVGTYDYADGAQQSAAIEIEETSKYAEVDLDQKIIIENYSDWTLARTPSILPTATLLSETAITSATTTLDIRITASEDDAEESSAGAMYLDSSDIEMVADGGGDQTVGLRFPSVNIPAGATITNAYVQFQVDETPSGSTSLTVRGEKIANAPIFTTTANNITSRTLTTASVPWSPAGWPTAGAAGVDQRTPDITSVIQEIVDQGAWANGNSLAIIISGTGERVAESYDGDANGAPLLHVVYDVSSGNQSPVVGITTPADGSSHVQGSNVTFTGTATDAEDGNLAANLTWTSSLDGALNGGTAAASFSTSALTVGAHTITASVTDSGSLAGQDAITVNITSPPSNTAPVVNAGADQNINFPADATLNATVTDDGLIAAPTYTWTKESGPGTVTFANASAEDTTAGFSVEGTYVLRLTVYDGELTTFDNLTVTTSTASETTLDIRVSTSTDDAEEGSTGTMYLNSSDLEMVNDNGDQTVGMRFNAVNIPAGATITNAYVQFQVDETPSAATSLTVRGEKTANATTFTTATNDITSRTLTTASVPWSPAGWPTPGAEGVDQRTPDIAEVIQEIVDQGAWASGNSIAVIVSGTGERVAVSYDDDPSAAPLLHVVFTTGSPPAQVSVPNVVGSTQAAATSAITGAGLILGNVTDQSSSTVPSGDVISQNPTSGTSVASGSAVDIVVSTGPAPVASGGGPHAVKVAGPFIYGYDANGNMTSGANRTLTYDFENRPTSITSSGTTTTFQYDGDGGRVQKTVGSTTTVYVGKLYVCENGACTKMIFAGSQQVAEIEVNSGTTQYYHPDHLGSTSVITDSFGVKVQGLTYYPFGDTVPVSGAEEVRFKYTGKERDESTGLYFYEARYYDPFLGRFISADTIVPDPLDPQALNRYSYALNNPILYTDPTGNFSFAAFAIGAAIGAFTTAIQGGSIGDIFTSAAISGLAAGVGFETFGSVSDAAAASGFGKGAAGIIAGISAGAASGFTASFGSLIFGSNNVNFGQSIGLGALSGAAGGGLSTTGLSPQFKILANSLVAGGIAELAGGEFATGFSFAFVTSAVIHFAEKNNLLSRSKKANALFDVADAEDIEKSIEKFVKKSIKQGIKLHPGVKKTLQILDMAEQLSELNSFQKLLTSKGHAIQITNPGSASNYFNILRNGLNVSESNVRDIIRGGKVFRSGERNFTLRTDSKDGNTLSIKTDGIDQQVIIRFGQP